MIPTQRPALLVGPGEGLVARHGGAVLALVRVTTQQRRVAEELLDLLDWPTAPAGGDTGRLLSRQVAGILVREEPEQVPSFCLLAASGRGMVVVIHGDVDAVVSGPGASERLSGRNVSTWVDRIIAEPFDSLCVGPAGLQDQPAGLDARLDLRDGVVSGGWAALVPAGPGTAEQVPAEQVPAGPGTAGPGPAATGDATLEVGDRSDWVGLDTGPVAVPPPAPAPEPPISAGREAPAPRVSGHFVSFALGGAAPDELDRERAPLPVAGAPTDEPVAAAGGGQVVVKGVLCSRRHFNHPDSSYCASCGISMVHVTHNLVDGPRLPLGVIVFDDGATYTLDANYVIGREPDGDPAVLSGQARPLLVDDDDLSLSRVHAAIVLNGWDVAIVDRGSTNGTSIARPGEQTWTRLAPERPEPLVPGTRVMLGKRTLVFDSTLLR